MTETIFQTRYMQISSEGPLATDKLVLSLLFSLSLCAIVWQRKRKK